MNLIVRFFPGGRKSNGQRGYFLVHHVVYVYFIFWEYFCGGFMYTSLDKIGC